MTKLVLIMIAVAVVLTVAVLALFARGEDTADDPRTLRAPSSGGAGVDAAEDFLATYVDDGGRVVREDQGGDTVSEGQAYALLLALATGEDATFDKVWTWTRDNLQRDDGLFAWRWAGGQVADESPAADADLDIASALAAGAERFDRAELRDEAIRIADAVMQHETAETDGGRVLVAGPWAVGDRVVNPSYLARCDYDQLAELTGDDGWRDVGTTSLDILDTLIEDGLPPDWAVVGSDGTPTPVAGADGADGPGRYSMDAARVPVLLATCDDGRPLAGQLWSRVRELDEDGAGLAYGLDGERLEDATHPLGLVGAAAAAHADGDASASRRLLREASRLEERQPTYYGAAWVAFGQLWLEDHDEDQGASPVEVELVAAVQEQPTTTVEDTTTTPTTEPSTTTTTDGTTSPSTTEPTSSSTTDGSSGSTTSTSTPAAPGASSSTTSTTAPVETGDLSSDDGAQQVLGGSGGRGGGSPDEPARRRTGALALGGAVATIVLGAALGLRERRVNLLRS